MFIPLWFRDLQFLEGRGKNRENTQLQLPVPQILFLYWGCRGDGIPHFLTKFIFKVRAKRLKLILLTVLSLSYILLTDTSELYTHF